MGVADSDIASQLMSYDIILLTRQRFEQELNGSSAPCICPPSSPCECRANFDYRSPLRDLHFLRIIIDEGTHLFFKALDAPFQAILRL